MNHRAKSRLGAIRRYAAHGNPGTDEGRSKGGKKTALFYRENPSLAKMARFVIRKPIKYSTYSSELAEFVGIMLGDGSFRSDYQFTITYGTKTDVEYAKFICNLIEGLFDVTPSVFLYKKSNTADIIVSSVNLCDYLKKIGLSRGNKVKRQVGVPDWIQGQQEFEIACVRGLMDTDGGFYVHRYKSGPKFYEYLKLCFTNKSQPLLDFVNRVLNNLGISAFTNKAQNGIFVYNAGDVKKYYSLVHTNNPKQAQRYKKFHQKN